ncbi:DinB family protein [Dyadobacter sp. SG02]|uniref:DinB family protein n=1 Tax=Dyadobacter sp. SG02 TaxID=1855291 RepID=UPI00115FE411|nr:DinB family protein [Dyadobacter sp. SG02]
MNRQLTKSIETVLAQIGAMLDALSDEQYRRTLPVLSGASLGGHVRHVIEFFIELDRGYQTGKVNYDARSRDKAIEQHRRVALASLRRVTASLNKENKVLLLASAAEAGDTGFHVTTNYERELVYNLEHAVHHMALIKIGIGTLTALHLPESFGVAGSTLRYRQAQCAP